jgi:nucleotide sugar dehydrogenase
LSSRPVSNGNGIQWLCVSEKATLRDVLQRFEGAVERGLPSGIALVVDPDQKLVGTVTDGDFRRALLRSLSLDTTAASAMRKNPITFREGTSYQTIIRTLPRELERRGRRGARFLGKIVLTQDDGRPTRVLDYHQLWEQRVATHRHVVVIGLGYVGLTLALRLAELGFNVTGVDVDKRKIEALGRGESYVHEQGLPELLREQLGDRFTPMSSMPENGDVFFVAVGTPVGTDKDDDGPTPQLDALKQAVDMLAQRIMPGALVVLRSTVPVGTTRELVAPMIEELTGLRAGTDFHLAFAPERTVEGRALKELSELPQIIGGVNEDSVEATVALFRELTPTIVRVESLEAAEMAKLANNAFRDVIFGFANEMARIASGFNLDASAVIDAANYGYPRDRIPFPSPGVGGPCLTKDPYILASAARRAKIDSTLSHHARSVNESMHELVANAIVAELTRLGKSPKSSTVLVCGLAFKGVPETADIRNSSALDIIDLLKQSVGEVLGHDPVVPKSDIQEAGIMPVELPGAFTRADAVLFLNNHPFYQKLDVFQMVRALRARPIVYDGWRLFRADEVIRTHPSVYMGLGFVRRSAELENGGPSSESPSR